LKKKLVHFKALMELRSITKFAAKQITLQRNAYKRGRQWFVAGEKVAGGSLKVSDGSSRRFVEVETTLADAVKQLAAEVDKLHATAVGQAIATEKEE
jgi:hypothetical protein